MGDPGREEGARGPGPLPRQSAVVWGARLCVAEARCATWPPIYPHLCVQVCVVTPLLLTHKANNMDAQVYPCLPAKNTSIPHPCCRPERKESGQFLKASRGVTTVPVGSNIHSAFVLYTSTVFLGHCRFVCPGRVHITYRDLFLWWPFFLDFTRRRQWGGGGTGSGGAGGTWVHPCTEHAPPYTCAPRAPSPHPCSSKMPERFASGARARVARTRPGGQVSGDRN